MNFGKCFLTSIIKNKLLTRMVKCAILKMKGKEMISKSHIAGECKSVFWCTSLKTANFSRITVCSYPGCPVAAAYS